MEDDETIFEALIWPLIDAVKKQKLDVSIPILGHLDSKSG
jgi:hypothetical protein